MTPFSLAVVTAFSEMWDSWLSRMSRTGLLVEQLVWRMKCSTKMMKVSSFIHPDLVERPTDPAGDPFRNCSLKRTRGNTNMGGIAFPVAFTAQATVTSSPRSADVTEPTCFFPFSVTICFGVCTAVTQFRPYCRSYVAGSYT